MQISFDSPAGTVASSVNPDPSVRDERTFSSPSVVDVYSSIENTMRRRGPQSLEQLRSRAQMRMRDLGIGMGFGSAPGTPPPRLDLFPRIIDSGEWETLCEGLLQRLTVWNAFLRDIHSAQEVLRSGVVPHRLVYSAPQYLRAAVGVAVPQDVYAHVAAFDLVRGTNGDWIVTRDHLSFTAGSSDALQSRQILNQVFPDLFAECEILSNRGYATSLLEHLRRFDHHVSADPRVVLLSGGSRDHTDYEHSFLARQMGIPLVHGTDLIVLNSHVYLKTIGGLEPIDVIYRRLRDALADPISFDDTSASGVPGLMACVRKGTVTLANAVGSGLGQHRALGAYLPKMARFYLGEPLAIQTIPRWLCADPDQCEQVLASLDDFILTDAQGDPARDAPEPGRNTERAEEEGPIKLLDRIRAHPGDYVAESKLPATVLPSFTPGGWDFTPVELRVFVFGGPAARVCPCPLTRFAINPDPAIPIGDQIRGIKDTWILGGEKIDSDPAPTILSSSQRRLRLGSRIADSLFWMGRYTERAENTTRILRVLQELRWERHGFDSEEDWTPLWEALARATGHPTHYFKRAGAKRRQHAAWYLLMEKDNPSSVTQCLRRCRANAQNTRESVPPEVWVIINRLCLMMEDAVPRRKSDWASDASLPEILELQDRILNDLEALTGSVGKHMLRADGWHFWSMGTHLERALTTVLVVRQIFLKRPDQNGAGAEMQRDERHLDSLLRMLACQYAYRSLFQSHPNLQNAAAMLLQDRQVPRSMCFCLEQIKDSLDRVFGNPYSDGWSADNAAVSPIRICARIIGEVEFADLNPYFETVPGRKTPRLRNWLEALATRLDHLSGAIADHYLNHQAFNILH